jgi:hypothetical protein
MRAGVSTIMRTSKLFGVFCVVAAVFLFSRSTDWQFGYLIPAGLLAFLGALLLSRRRIRHLPRRQVYVTSKPAIP